MCLSFKETKGSRCATAMSSTRKEVKMVKEEPIHLGKVVELDMMWKLMVMGMQDNCLLKK